MRVEIPALVDEQSIGLDSLVKERITRLVHEHLGSASVVVARINHDPFGICLRTTAGVIIVDRTMTKLIEIVQRNTPLV